MPSVASVSSLTSLGRPVIHDLPNVRLAEPPVPKVLPK